MKKAITIVSLALLVFACSRKTTNTAQTTTPAPTTTETTATVNAEHAAMVEQGKTVYTTRCNRCHALKDVTAYTTTRWDGILKSMVPKAKLDSTQAQQVTAYVMENAKK
jgi:cytochrome c5